MWHDVVALLELLIETTVGWVKGLGSFLSKLLVLYWFIACIVFVFAIDFYQEREEFWGRQAFAEAVIWPYAFYHQYNQYHTSKECDYINEEEFR